MRTCQICFLESATTLDCSVCPVAVCLRCAAKCGYQDRKKGRVESTSHVGRCAFCTHALVTAEIPEPVLHAAREAAEQDIERLAAMSMPRMTAEMTAGKSALMQTHSPVAIMSDHGIEQRRARTEIVRIEVAARTETVVRTETGPRTAIVWPVTGSAALVTA